MSEELIEQLGELADKADNFVALQSFMPPHLLVNCLIQGLHEISDELKDIVREYSDIDPWEDSNE